MTALRTRPWTTSVAGNVVVGGCGVASGAVLARVLGPEGRGVVAQATLWPSIVLTAGAVVNVQTIAYFRARHGIAGRQACLLLALAVALLLLPIAWIVNWAALGRAGLAGYAAANVYALTLPLSVVGGVLTASLLGEMRIGGFWLIRATTAVAITAGVLVLSVTRMLSPVNYCILVGGALFGTALLALAMQRPPVLGAERPSRALLRSVLSFGARTNMTLLPYQLNLRLDQLLTSVMLPAAVLGRYSVAFAWSSTLSLIGGAFSTVVLAQTTQIDPASAPDVRRMVGRVRRSCIVVAALGLVASLLAPVAVPLIFGPRFADAVVPAQILCIASIVLNVNLLLHELARGLGQPGVGGAPEWSGLAVSALGLWLLLPRYQAVGAALASLAGYTAIAVVLLAAILRRVPDLHRSMLVPRQSDFTQLWMAGLAESRRLLGGGEETPQFP